MRKAYIEKTFGERKRNGRKVEDYSWEVTFFEDFPEGRLDRHYYNNEQLALDRAKAFENGQYHLSEFGGVAFDQGEEF